MPEGDDNMPAQSRSKQFNAAKSQPAYKASDFEFAVIEGDEAMGEGKYFAVIRPKGDEEGWKKSYEIESQLKGATSIDDSVYALWKLPKKFATPAAIAQQFSALGVTWNRDLQNDMGPEFTKGIEAARNTAAAPKKATP